MAAEDRLDEAMTPSTFDPGDRVDVPYPDCNYCARRECWACRSDRDPCACADREHTRPNELTTTEEAVLLVVALDALDRAFASLSRARSALDDLIEKYDERHEAVA